jgi:O-antigen ligase
VGNSGVSVALPFTLTALWLGLLMSGLGGDADYLLPAAVVTAIGIGVITYHASMRKSWALLTILTVSVLLTPISFRVREQGVVGLDMQNGIKVVIWFVMLIVCAPNARQILSRIQTDPMLLALVSFSLVALVSSIYSPVPAVTAMSGLSLLAFLGFSVLLVSNLSFRRISLTVIAVLAVYCVLNLLSALVLPDMAYIADTGFRFQGISGHPNSLARQAAIFTILVIGSYYRGYLSRAGFFLITMLAVTTMLMTEGRTAIISIIIPLIICAGRRFVLPTLIVAAMAIILLLSGGTDSLLAMVGRDGDASEAMSMAGRTELWQFVMDQISQAPWFGHGYNSFESVATNTFYGQVNAAVATHNNYLEVLYSTGIIGGLPFFAAIGILLYRWIKHPFLPRDLIVLNIVVSSFTEVDITALGAMPMLIAFIVLARDSVDREIHSWGR